MKTMTSLHIPWLGVMVLAFHGMVAADEHPPCHPQVDPARAQYQIGYGSLMEKASLRRTAPRTGARLPVLVQGFQRAWNARGSEIGFSTTYLGALVDADATMAAALYRVLYLDDLLATDKRENIYCRVAVEPEAIRLLDGSRLPEDAQFWVYVNKLKQSLAADARFPIVQSYLDTFLTGCLQLDELAIGYDDNFAEACVETTDGWSEHWVNDRLYPRRPFMYQPNAGTIDRLLHRLVPEFQKVRIE